MRPRSFPKRFPKQILIRNISERSLRIKNIIRYLSKNGRAPILQIARDLGIPKSTVFDYMQEIKYYYDFTIVEKHETKGITGI